MIEEAKRHAVPLLVYGWAQLVLLGWWAINFPAQLTADSTTYIRHVTVGPWIADHSVLYDFFILCSLKLTDNVWLIVFLQTIVYAVVLAVIAAAVHRMGVRWRWAALPCMLIVLVPSFGSFTSMLWKDVPFTAANLFFAATLLKVIADRRARLPMTVRTTVIMAVELTAITLFRNNGFVVVAFIAIGLLIALKSSRRKVIAAVVATFVIFEFASIVVYPAAGIKSAGSSESYGVFYGDIALVYSERPSAFTAGELSTMKKVAPLKTWRSSNDCLSSDHLFASKHFSTDRAAAHRHQLAEIWFSLLKRAPEQLIRGHLCRAAIAWRVPPTWRFSGLPRVTNHNLYTKALILGYTNYPPLPSYLIPRLRPHPINKQLYLKAADSRRAIARDPLLQLLFSRAPGWTYLTYLAILIAAFRNRWKMLILAGLPLLANQLTVIAANPAQLYRYTAAQLFLGMLFIPLVSAWSPQRPAPPDEADPADAPDPDRRPAVPAGPASPEPTQ
ncbi:DUF6020 family protein [Flexivirga caeni]|uniref:DUF6020 family protein n=1 Tax=Flexivirga caeni TaxID=2294115 RepID=UPI0011CDCFE6|nr:DUF6020 family protein [Flexivirga caeni]